MFLTVFTPTYNRAELLEGLFQSLCKQTLNDFEWLIVDDGSTDNTQLAVEKFLQSPDAKFPVRYIFQENGGKHRAINRGVNKARGELFLILDSDDTLPSDSLEWIAKHYEQIRNDKTFGGVCGYMANHDGTVIGCGNADEVLDTNSIDMRFRYHIQGDMCEVFRTEVLREFPFPDIKGEKFVPEALVWNRIAQKYKLRVFHHVVYFRDYLDGGLTDRIVRIRMNSPIASMMTYAEMTQLNIPFAQKAKAAINYWRFRGNVNENENENNYPVIPKDNIPHLDWWWNWTRPIGKLMHLKDCKA